MNDPNKNNTQERLYGDVIVTHNNLFLLRMKNQHLSIWKGYAPVAPAYCIAVGIVFGFEIYQGGML